MITQEIKEAVIKDLSLFMKACCMCHSYKEVFEAYLQGEKAMIQLIADIKDQMK